MTVSPRCGFLACQASHPPISLLPTSADLGRAKQFRKGIEQWESEGVVQVLRSDRRGDASPVFAAIGPMQFEVAALRLDTGLSIPCSGLLWTGAGVVRS
jgi:peptide subunit release factor RF-3